MAALAAKAGMSLLGAGGLIPKPGADTAVLAVRIGRVLYIGSAVYIAGLWYWGWRNERANPGEFPIPGIHKGGVIRPGGAADADDAADVTLDPSPNADVGTGINQGNTPLNDLGTVPTNPSNLTGSHALLMYLGKLAPHFGLTATENPNFGGVHPVHVTGSYHNTGRAIDFVGPIANLSTFAAWLDTNYRSRLTELIWAGPGPKAVKNGKSVPSSFYAAVWANHKTHVHVAI